MDSPSSVQRSHRKQAAATEFLSFDFVSTVPQSEYWNTLGKFQVVCRSRRRYEKAAVAIIVTNLPNN